MYSPACCKYELALSVLFSLIFLLGAPFSDCFCERFSDIETFSNVGSLDLSILLVLTRFSSFREAALSLVNFEFKEEGSGLEESKSILGREDFF